MGWICFEMTYGKRITSQATLKTLSGPVLYTNLLSIPAMAMSSLPSLRVTLIENPEWVPDSGTKPMKKSLP